MLLCGCGTHGGEGDTCRARCNQNGQVWVGVLLNRTLSICLSSTPALYFCSLCQVTDICGLLSLLYLLSSGVRIADPNQKGRGRGPQSGVLSLLTPPGGGVPALLARITSLLHRPNRLLQSLAFPSLFPGCITIPEIPQSVS